MPKQVFKAKKADNKVIASATDISLALSTIYTATTHSQITSIQTKKASKAKKAILLLRAQILILNSQRPQMPLR